MCSICANDFNQTQRRELTCNGCNASCCMICFETYVVLSMKDTDCMFCHKRFDREFFAVNTSGAFQKRLKSHREKVLLDREKAKLPETMELHFEYDLNMKTLKNEIVIKKEILLELSQSIKSFIKTDDKKKEQRLEIQKLKKDKRETLNYIRINSHRVYRWYAFEKTDEQSVVVSSIDTKIKTKKIMCQCPQSECNGFVYNTEKCGVCNVTVCKECRSVKSETDIHKCNTDDVETVKMLNFDSKGCPKCATPIFKISGCDQMWCTQCHTAFGWKTGKIVSSNIHNPHYFHWLHNNQGQHVDGNQDNLNQCGGLIQYDQLIIHARLVCLETQRLYISEMYRLRLHLENVELFRMRPIVPINEENVNLDLRLKYLRKQISQEKWMFELQKREKAKLFTQSKIQIFDMVVTVINDLFHRILHTNSTSGVEEILNEFIQVIDYANTSFYSLHVLYKVVVPTFVFDPIRKNWIV